MRKLNKKAFNILTNDEQSSLALQKVHGKSTWEAGSILNRSHYKYLEIKQRAERFFELFSNHYDTYNALIPPSLKLDPLFSKYVEYTIEKRMAVKKAALKVGGEIMAKKSDRDSFLVKCITKLKNSDSLDAQNLYGILMEFDRYNNFRILPGPVQEPSAFKRRNKTRFRKHLTISTTISGYILMRIKELYEYTKGPKPKVMGYIALTNYSEEKAFERIVKVNATDKVVKELSSISIYVFPKEELATEYIKLVRDYIIDLEKDPKKGLIFWPQFRNLIKDSLNYNDINNIAPSRKGITTAIADMDINWKRRQKKTQDKNSYK